MQLSLHTDHAVKFLICMTRYSSRSASVQDISGRCGLSAQEVAGVLHDLDRCGLIERSTAGDGLLRLRKDPARVRVGDVIRCIEAARPATRQAGAFAQMFDMAHAAFMEALNDYSLSDIAHLSGGEVARTGFPTGAFGVSVMVPG
ncbi:RrF2 family transcriptional regulator [Gluconacetobacter entanii]|uniref:RrF2 family transcriptional regulator n=1 Tax=Gluconacetobacter entanii TaxID=108528 RepID=UPI0021BBBE90|nr:Rrf2 family transcriptional regulator [Gluconacetobacter entanii]MCW4579620.1 Rrf2 family transcriptional regulator [Gluconacetobacter entanii]MCW4583013.1 Rrf2 family transcriptional regulator [Gluconacetobacter entanii]MCW4586404.1 Rrf2 family transcriptional regulator [Gluconacetobacter entanii]